MNITKFGLSNFRVFKEHFDFELAPIMVLTGPNNSGKSSLSKALLLLKDNEDMFNSVSYLIPEGLNYFTGDHDLGNHKLTINRKGQGIFFTFSFFKEYKLCIGFDEYGCLIWDYTILTPDNEIVITQMGAHVMIYTKEWINYLTQRLSYMRRNASTEKKPEDVNIENKIELFIDGFINFSETFDKIDVDLFDNVYSNINYLDGDGQPLSFEEKKQLKVYSPSFPDGISIEDAEWQEALRFLFEDITSIKFTDSELNLLIPISKPGYFAFDGLFYINTMKEPLKRTYSKNDFSVIQSLIKNELTKEETGYYFVDKMERYKRTISSNKKADNVISYLQIARESFELFTKKWLMEFEIGQELSYGYDESHDIFFIKIDGVSLPEYGLGYGLIIHILLALSNEIGNKKNNNELRSMFINNQSEKLLFPRTYIIEEPETGLHPAFQSKMAEMIVDIQKTFNVNLIIETHSEYLIRKLQYLTATNEVNSGDVVIYYFNNPKKVPENEEQIKRITILKDGSLSDNFGPGFIDEGINLKFELLRLNKSQIN